ncbi:hypothetical protein BC828DRAFT_381479 [Blastocladiella britannica]|nr:hypothetical protein BC828DRAFT_381479 [Blastocladiella britannica]
MFCKCACAANATIIPVDACGQCKIALCLAVARHDNATLPDRPDYHCSPSPDTVMDARCFDRASRKDEWMVSVYLALLAALLFVALFRPLLDPLWAKIRASSAHARYARLMHSEADD